MLHFLGGVMKYSLDTFIFFAPIVNSYKRFKNFSWAPSNLDNWSVDNRTSPFRICGSGKSLRIEYRIPGGDINQHLAYAGLIAAVFNFFISRELKESGIKSNPQRSWKEMRMTRQIWNALRSTWLVLWGYLKVVSSLERLLERRFTTISSSFTKMKWMRMRKLWLSGNAADTLI